VLHKLKMLIEKASPKHIGQSIKKDQLLENWLLEQTQNLAPEVSLSERAYSVINNISNLCEYNAIKKFKSFKEGYGFCGMTKNCKCAQESVSEKVSASKANKTTAEKLETNSRRAATNIARYGVTNSGQTLEAKQRHKDTYNNKAKVTEIVAKHQKTVQDKYGVSNVAALSTVKQKKVQTNLVKFGVDNPMKNKEISAKATATKQQRYEPHHLAKQNYPRFIQMVVENFGVTPQISAQEYIGVQTRPEMKFECVHCATSFVKRFDYASPPICKVCYPTSVEYKSKEELELLAYVKSIYPGNVISGDRRSINPYEIDILLPELKIGIEYCGLYWHSENSGKKSWNYHYRKFDAARNKNIRLITIFSDEWAFKKETLKQYLAVTLGQQSASIWARKCNFQKISHTDAKTFLAEYHMLSAPQRMSWTGGLTLNGTLEGVMCFKKHSAGEYELTRFATKTHVVGAASKLLKTFIQEVSPAEIFSFSDNRFSQGAVYKTLGFEQTGIVPPMQSYVENYSARHHKRSMKKGKLLRDYPHLDQKLSEWALLQSLGYDRIWDCGKIKWTLKLK
jgi:hypothetical protein